MDCYRENFTVYRYLLQVQAVCLFWLNLKNYSPQHCHGVGAGVDPGFVESDTIFGKLQCKITNTKLGMKVNVYLWPFPGPWKGP
jgi:hypothetical protein